MTPENSGIVRLFARGVALSALGIYAFGVQAELLLHPSGVTFFIDARFPLDFVVPGLALAFLIGETIRSRNR